MAGAVALASTGYIAAIDEKAWRATSARPGVQGSPQREPACPRRQLESRVRERKSSHPFGAGAGSQPSCGRRDRLSPANGTPEELRRLARPACYQ